MIVCHTDFLELSPQQHKLYQRKTKRKEAHYYDICHQRPMKVT